MSRDDITVAAVFTLVYVSTLRRPLSRSGLADLLDECRDRNAVLDVTGLLVIHDSNVMQVLEGDEHAIRDLYRLIAADSRHHAVMTLWTGTAEHRRLPDWTMAYEDLDERPTTADRPDDTLVDQPPHGAVTSRGTAEQAQYVRRRDAALRRALAHGKQLLPTLAVLTHGHDPETARHRDGTTSLRCRECRILADHDSTLPAHNPYPCPIAVDALDALETSRN